MSLMLKTKDKEANRRLELRFYLSQNVRCRSCDNIIGIYKGDPFHIVMSEKDRARFKEKYDIDVTTLIGKEVKNEIYKLEYLCCPCETKENNVEIMSKGDGR